MWSWLAFHVSNRFTPRRNNSTAFWLPRLPIFVPLRRILECVTLPQSFLHTHVLPLPTLSHSHHTYTCIVTVRVQVPRSRRPRRLSFPSQTKPSYHLGSQELFPQPTCTHIRHPHAFHPSPSTHTQQAGLVVVLPRRRTEEEGAHTCVYRRQ